MINENPDRNGKWKAPDAIAFGVIDDNIYIGYNPYIIDKYCKQSETLQSLSKNFDMDPAKMSHFWIGIFYTELYGPDFADNFCGVSRDQFNYSGRIWLNDKIISFWNYPSKKDLLKILLALKSEIYKIYSINIDIYDFKIELDPIDGDFFSYENEDDIDHNKINYVTINQYENGIKRSPEELRMQHIDVHADKSNLKKGIKKIKLPKGMTQAEYNSLIRTSESKTNHKVIIIDEDKVPLLKLLSKKNSLDKIIDENFNTEIKASDISLNSFNQQKELNPKIWINNNLNSRVRLRLLDIADDFIDSLGIDWVEPIDIIITGSLTNYNWSKYSDIDLHIIYDFKKIDDKVDLVRNFFNSKRTIWNNEHENLKIYNFPVELYVQDINEEHISSGTYSLEKNEWIKMPRHENSIQLEKNVIKYKAADIMTAIDDLYAEYENEDDEYKIDEISLKVKKLFDKIKKMRKLGLKEDGEMSVGNIVFKICRRFGYIDKLYDLKLKTYDKLKSIS